MHDPSGKSVKVENPSGSKTGGFFSSIQPDVVAAVGFAALLIPLACLGMSGDDLAGLAALLVILGGIWVWVCRHTLNNTLPALTAWPYPIAGGAIIGLILGILSRGEEAEGLFLGAVFGTIAGLSNKALRPKGALQAAGEDYDGALPAEYDTIFDELTNRHLAFGIWYNASKQLVARLHETQYAEFDPEKIPELELEDYAEIKREAISIPPGPDRQNKEFFCWKIAAGILKAIEDCYPNDYLIGRSTRVKRANIAIMRILNCNQLRIFHFEFAIEGNTVNIIVKACSFDALLPLEGDRPSWGINWNDKGHYTGGVLRVNTVTRITKDNFGVYASLTQGAAKASVKSLINNIFNHEKSATKFRRYIIGEKSIAQLVIPGVVCAVLWPIGIILLGVLFVEVIRYPIWRKRAGQSILIGLKEFLIPRFARLFPFLVILGDAEKAANMANVMMVYDQKIYQAIDFAVLAFRHAPTLNSTDD